MKRKINTLFLFATIFICSAVAQTETYSKVTSTAQLIPGASYLFVNEGDGAQYANKGLNNGKFEITAITLSNGSFEKPADAVPFILGGASNEWTFYFEGNGYLYVNTSNEIFSFNPDLSLGNVMKWEINFSLSDISYIKNNSLSKTCYIRYWSGNFKVVTSATPISLYRKDGIYSMAADAETDPVYWATFSDLNNATFFPSNEATVYIVVRNSNMVVSLTPLSTQTVGAVEGYVVPAGKGVMVRSTSTQVSYSTTSATSENNDTFFADNLLHAANGAISQETGHTYYKLAYATPGQGQSRDVTTLGFYYAVAGGAAYTPSAGKAYLDWDSSLGAPARFVLNEMEETETPTRIESLSSKEAPCKVLKNGQLFILVNGTCYSVTGQTLQNR